MKKFVLLAGCFLVAQPAWAGVGDPQVSTDHPWYPGELACSTFKRLFATQAAVYKRVTGRPCVTDEDKALASWLWRNTHYFHGEEGAENVWGQGFDGGDHRNDMRNREYWTGLFSHGYGLCGTTHSQWCAEMEALLGHARGRGVGVNGHNTFEVFLKGGEYGDGQWALLDHDQSTVVFDPQGRRLLGMKEITGDWKKLTDRTFELSRQRGWLPCGLHPSDAGTYSKFQVAEYLAGYAGPPPMVHLRRGERFRRWFEPGLDDGKTFAFWGMNYGAGGIPGPERNLTWVNQPDKMFGSKTGAPGKTGQARFANAEFIYRPDFASGDYREGVVSEDDARVVFEFRSPYVIAATPSQPGPWGIYKKGTKNGLVLFGDAGCKVSVSVDRGQNFIGGGVLDGQLDLTDLVKGHRQYWLALHASAKDLATKRLIFRTVCEANAATMPRLKDDGATVRFQSSDQAVVSAGPNVAQAKGHIIAGQFDSPSVTLELKTPRGEPITGVYAAAHMRSSAPPDPNVKYHVDASFDGGKTWRPVVADWTVLRQGDEPGDFWSQSLCWGHLTHQGDGTSVRVRFRNTGGKSIARAEANLSYKVIHRDPIRVTFVWSDSKGEHSSNRLINENESDISWTLATAAGVRTKLVVFEPEPRKK